MSGFFNALSAVFVIFLIMSLGWLLGHLGWLSATEKKFISKYVVNIAVPVNCVTGVLGSFSREELLASGGQVMVAAVVVGITLLLSAGVGKLLRLPRKRWGVFVVMGGISNTMLIGMPVITQLYGDKGLPYLMMYYLFSTIYTQTVAVMLCEHAGGKEGGNIPKLTEILAELVKKPPVLGVVLAFALLLLDVKLPTVVMSAGTYISNTVTPLALIYSGFVIYEVGLRQLRFLPGLPAALIIRMVISPVICLMVCMLMGVHGLARDVFIVSAALPVIGQLTVFSGVYAADEQYAAIGSSLSVLSMFLTLPVIMLIL